MFLTCQASDPTNQHRKYIRTEYQFHCHTGPSVRAAMQSRPRWPASLFVAYYRCSIEKNEKLCGPGPAQPSTRGSHYDVAFSASGKPEPTLSTWLAGNRGTREPRKKKLKEIKWKHFCLRASSQPCCWPRRNRGEKRSGGNAHRSCWRDGLKSTG